MNLTQKKLPDRLIIAGIGTNVGKTLCAAIIAKALHADYWKPVQCGNLDDADTDRVASLINNPAQTCHREAFRLKKPASPHFAAEQEKIVIETKDIIPPSTDRMLVIECAGGLLVPLNETTLQIDFLGQFNCPWILVSRHYLGSINHTLLSIEALKQRGIKLAGIIFNGEDLSSGEKVIIGLTGTAVLGHLKDEPGLNTPLHAIKTIERYAEQWKPQLNEALKTHL